VAAFTKPANRQASESVVGELIAGRYELEELAGSGGMSRVCRARDRQLGRLVAIKILHDHYADDREQVERFRREARAVARLSHPSIVTVIDRGEADGRQYIVFEYVEGENLKQLVRRAGPLPARRAVEVAIEIARALAYAHAHGVVHRDVKPQNVLLRDDGLKVTDFGIARSVGGPAEGQTVAGTVLGTGDYIAPEQARGEQADERSDVYSLGALLYELLTGTVPFPADTAVAAAMRHVSDPVPDVLERRQDAPVRVAEAISRAMSKDQRDRFASMDDFLAELTACRNELPSPEAARTMIMPPPRRAPAQAPGQVRKPRPRRRRRAALATALVLLLAGAAAIGYVLEQRSGPGPVLESNPAVAGTVHLTAVGAYDPPPGDGHERDDLVANATDGNPSTSWQTENYTTAPFGNLKQGVGLVVDAGRSLRLGSLTVTSPTPGFTAVVKAASSTSGPFEAVSSPERVGSSTTFDLHVPAARRYYLIWLTMLTRYDTGDATKPFGARISEITGQ
jgi:eukaryotic-like serine/threonine-protein kinase